MSASLTISQLRDRETHRTLPLPRNPGRGSRATFGTALEPLFSPLSSPLRIDVSHSTGGDYTHYKKHFWGKYTIMTIDQGYYVTHEHTHASLEEREQRHRYV